jgi:hypothetical protein
MKIMNSLLSQPIITVHSQKNGSNFNRKRTVVLAKDFGYVPEAFLAPFGSTAQHGPWPPP